MVVPVWPCESRRFFVSLAQHPGVPLWKESVGSGVRNYLFHFSHEEVAKYLHVMCVIKIVILACRNPLRAWKILLRFQSRDRCFYALDEVAIVRRSHKLPRVACNVRGPESGRTPQAENKINTTMRLSSTLCPT